MTSLDVVERGSYGEHYPLFSALKYRKSPKILRLVLKAGAPVPPCFPAECVGELLDESTITAFLDACLERREGRHAGEWQRKLDGDTVDQIVRQRR